MTTAAVFTFVSNSPDAHDAPQCRRQRERTPTPCKDHSRTPGVAATPTPSASYRSPLSGTLQSPPPVPRCSAFRPNIAATGYPPLLARHRWRCSHGPATSQKRKCRWVCHVWYHPEVSRTPVQTSQLAPVGGIAKDSERPFPPYVRKR